MNLGTWRIAIIVVLVVVGVAVLANGFDDDGTAIAGPGASPSPTGTGGEPTTTTGPSPEPTDEPVETPPPNESGVLVKVFNGTSVPGLAALVQEDLVAAGHEAPEEPGNAPAAPVAKTTVYYRGGPGADQHQADATFIAQAFVEPVLGKMPRVDELSSVFDDVVGATIEVVVLIGGDYSANLPAGGTG